MARGSRQRIEIEIEVVPCAFVGGLSVCVEKLEVIDLIPRDCLLGLSVDRRDQTKMEARGLGVQGLKEVDRTGQEAEG